MPSTCQRSWIFRKISADVLLASSNFPCKMYVYPATVDQITRIMNIMTIGYTNPALLFLSCISYSDFPCLRWIRSEKKMETPIRKKTPRNRYTTDSIHPPKNQLQEDQLATLTLPQLQYYDCRGRFTCRIGSLETRRRWVWGTTSLLEFQRCLFCPFRLPHIFGRVLVLFWSQPFQFFILFLVRDNKIFLTSTFVFIIQIQVFAQ